MPSIPTLINLETIQMKEQYAQATQGYASIQITNLIPQTTIPCSIYFPSLKPTGDGIELKVLLPAGKVYSRKLHDHLLGQGIQEIYIGTDKLDAYFDYFQQNTSRIVKSLSVPVEKKVALLYENAELVVKKLFDESPSPSNLSLGQEFVENFTTHISLDKLSADTLFSMFSRDYSTYSHCVQVALLGMSFAKYLGWTEGEVAEFGVGALFHDIGKNLIPENILNKRGSLNEKEQDAVKEHPLIGYRQLEATEMMTPQQLSIIRSHHEAADGSGYPEGLKGNEIPKYARVARIVDCYDAMTSNKPYREGFSRDKALRVMKNEMGQTFDSSLLKLFIHFLQIDPAAKDPTPEELHINLGCELFVQCHGENFRVKTTLVGMEAGQLLIVRPPQLTQIQARFQQQGPVVVRFVHAGTIYGFQAEVLNYVTNPLHLLFISYPHKIETINLRKNPRIDCFLLAEAEVQEQKCEGVILDLSVGGCKFVIKRSDTSSILALQLDEPITLRTELLGDRNGVTLPGMVRHVNLDENRIELGIQFLDLDQDTIESLNQCIQMVLELIPQGNSA
jgi:putative nucleotidyltransferase with HDIG domain